MGKVFFIVILFLCLAWFGRRTWVYFVSQRDADNARARLEKTDATLEVLNIEDEIRQNEELIEARTQTDKTEK